LSTGGRGDTPRLQRREQVDHIPVGVGDDGVALAPERVPRRFLDRVSGGGEALDARVDLANLVVCAS